jgi:hypothetical protein
MEEWLEVTRVVYAKFFLASVFVTLVASACGAGPDTESPGTTASSHDIDVFFPEYQPTGDVMTAEFRGKLVLDDESCLRVEWSRHGSVVPIWPSDYKLDTGSGEVRVLAGSGRVVARVGEEVYMSGGEIGRSLEGRRELEERCPGTYWIVGAEVRIPGQR